MADRLSAVARDFEARQRAGVGCRDPPADPELDQFMVLIVNQHPHLSLNQLAILV